MIIIIQFGIRTSHISLLHLWVSVFVCFWDLFVPNFQRFCDMSYFLRCKQLREVVALVEYVVCQTETNNAINNTMECTEPNQ